MEESKKFNKSNMSKRNYITVEKLSDSEYKLLFNDKSNLGYFVQEVDSYFYWCPNSSSKGSLYPDYILMEIAEKLIELNKK